MIISVSPAPGEETMARGRRPSRDSAGPAPARRGAGGQGLSVHTAVLLGERGQERTCLSPRLQARGGLQGEGKGRSTHQNSRCSRTAFSSLVFFQNYFVWMHP